MCCLRPGITGQNEASATSSSCCSPLRTADMSSLPQELLLLITVSRDWYLASRVGLFHTIEVFVGHNSCRSLHHLLLDSPHLAPLVRRLTLRARYQSEPPLAYRTDALCNKQRSRITIRRHIPPTPH
ncbi:hypothetical protein LshimejAT787_1900500 [Lyophyllum shimeji]|uniref:Uncharacterized protein n=1 Tax=Lyophyllum shimeji TaxID=47721 RepID=A0A9P3Q194_LYOSH|nr:hypothetical protein LshimejAT787_1900500 [Lyophyllum shimeji]